MAGNGLNPLDISEDLQNTGFTQEQAALLARVISQVADTTAATKQDVELATFQLKREIEFVRKDIEIVKRDIEVVKRDIETVRSELKRDIETVRSELKKDIELAKRDLKIWLGGFAVAGFGLLVAFAKLGLLTPAS